MIRLLVAVAGGYLIGSVPSGLWLGKVVAGVDVRATGSHRIGATNVQRSVGTGAGLVVLILDALKGFLAVFIVARVTGNDYVAALAGLAAVFGHVWSPLAGFRGGRGVATGAGALLAFSPIAILCTLVFMALTIAVTRYVSLGSIVAAVSSVLCTAFLLGRVAEPDAALLLALPGAVLVLLKHADNVERLVRGRESKLGSRAAPSNA
jgi:glycerol-3-phosphate acyltransferase PlsY